MYVIHTSVCNECNAFFCTEMRYQTCSFTSSRKNFSRTSAIKAPMVAIMEIRPCFNSTDRRRLKAATSPSAVKPTGSQNPTGACTPSSFSKAVSATSTHLLLWVGYSSVWWLPIFKDKTYSYIHFIYFFFKKCLILTLSGKGESEGGKTEIQTSQNFTSAHHEVGQLVPSF